MAKNTSGIPESDLVIPALRFAAKQSSGRIATSDLIKALTDLFKPSGTDAQILAGRKDTHFSQKVRNLVSHKESRRNLIRNGFATHYEVPGDRHAGGIEITQLGRNLLKSIGA